MQNTWLEKYEIKKPDYDYVTRDYIGMKDVEHSPVRFSLQKDGWVSKKKSLRFFNKSKAKLMFVGDITCFDKQIEEAQKGNDYDFNYELEKMKPVFSKADLVVGNLETMIMPEAPYRSEKFVSEQNFHCNAPIEFLDAIRNAGIDVLTTANNHILDTGAIGIGETIDYIERFGFIQTGAFKSDKKRYELINVNNIKIAIVAFATDFNNKKCNLTPEGADYLLNEYSKKRAKEIISQARNDGAEFVIVSIHWGKENVTTANTSQLRISEELVELGYDCIIGSHPHVLQPFTVAFTENKIVPVFYSMGNFLSHNANNLKARSAVACIDIEKKGSSISVEYSYIPIYTSKDYGPKKYVVLPIPPLPLDPRNIKKKDQIAEILGEEISQNTNIHFMECIEHPVISKSTVKKDPKPVVSKIKDFPVEYNDGVFVYSVYKDQVHIKGFSDECSRLSYSVSYKVLNLPIKELEDYAFQSNDTVKKINFSKNLSSISKGLCKNCIQLEGFQLGKNVKEISAEAFSGCTNLTAAVMKKKVEKIGSKAFENCSNLVNVKIPATVTEIADDAFMGCSSAVFYCPSDSYAEKYAKAHGFKVVNMNLD